MRLFRSSRRARLCVHSLDPTTVLFDAVLVLGRSRMQVQLLTGEQTPFELELPDGDCTAVVRARDPNDELEVEYSVDRSGKRRLYGRSRRALSLIERRGSGIVVGGLPTASAREWS